MALEYAILVMTFVTAASAASFLAAPGEAEAIVRARVRSVRLLEEKGAGNGGCDPELVQPFSQRVLEPVAARLREFVLRATPAGWLEGVSTRLREAGEPVDAATFLALRVLAALAGGLVLGWLLFAARSPAIGTGVRIALWLVGSGAVSTVPAFWLGRRVARRKADIQRALPEALDLLCVAVEAGLGLDGAVQKLSERMPGPLTEELARTLREMNLGHPREQAWRNLAARVNLPDLQMVTSAIVQAERLGTSLSQVLRVQAAEMRNRRRQRAEEKARQVPIKLLFPLVFFVFPAIFVVLLGPALLYFLSVVGGQL